jgi:ABC-type dipeptide/oligopeptide/nickel transport system permease subunit
VYGHQVPHRDPWTFIGVFAFFALLFVALFGERIAPHEPIYFVVEHGRDPRPYDPGIVFPFGSDVLGRDLFSLVLAGARATLTIVALGGLARVIAGIGLAVIGSWWAPARVLIDSVAELASAVPATLVALLVVKVFVKADTSVLMFVGALLLTGWAGPYRVIRAELGRLAHMQFTQGAVALGVTRSRIFSRHHLPHLLPLVATSTSQQVVASLVLVAELGVLGVFVGATRLINIGSSLTIVRTGPSVSAAISDPPEWGGLLANARTIESLWTTRWLFLAPGIALALTAVAVAAIGLAMARRYARRNVIHDLTGRGAGLIAAGALVLVVASVVVPARYAVAREWASAARAEARSAPDTEASFRAAGLRPLGSSFAVERDTTHIVQSGPASVAIGGLSAAESTEASTDLRPFVAAVTGGGRVDAPVVFASRGLSPDDYLPVKTSVFSAPDLGTLIGGFTDDYAGIDVRGKVVLLVRLAGVTIGRNAAQGPPVDVSIANAIKRGAAAVLFVDANLPRYSNVVTALSTSPYPRIEADLPVTDPSGGVPVIVLSPALADRLLAPIGLQASSFVKTVDGTAEGTAPSASRDLGVRARVEVPLERASAHVRSLVGEVGGVPTDRGRVLVWAVRHAGAAFPSADVAAALARELTARGSPFIFVDFDPSVDPTGNSRQVADALKDRRIALVIVLDDVDGAALRFTTPYGDLIPAIDRYADEAGARHVPTRSTLNIEDWSWPGVRPFFDVKGILVSATQGDGDLRGDAAALVGYLAGRLALGAEELPR